MDVNSNLPFVMLTRSFADKLMATADKLSLAQLEKDIDRDLKPRSHELKGWTLSERIMIDRTGIETKNVVGVLEGAGPHAEETVVIGGHYDHLGHGGVGSLSSDKKPAIHYGADDNASGTAGVLALAEYFGKSETRPARSIGVARASRREAARTPTVIAHDQRSVAGIWNSSEVNARAARRARP